MWARTEPEEESLREQRKIRATDVDAVMSERSF